MSLMDYLISDNDIIFFSKSNISLEVVFGYCYCVSETLVIMFYISL